MVHVALLGDSWGTTLSNQITHEVHEEIYAIFCYCLFEVVNNLVNLIISIS